jgi:hypothetical protein
MIKSTGNTHTDARNVVTSSKVTIFHTKPLLRASLRVRIVDGQVPSTFTSFPKTLTASEAGTPSGVDRKSHLLDDVELGDFSNEHPHEFTRDLRLIVGSGGDIRFQQEGVFG